jgi:hypothetical protein
MATWVASLLTKTIRNQLELIKVNEDYENELKPKISTTTEKFIKAICVYITNQQIQHCQPKINTSSKPTVVKNTDDLLRSYFDHNNKIDMLAYKPTDDSVKMGGGRKLDIKELIIMGGGLMGDVDMHGTYQPGNVGSGPAAGLGSAATAGLGSAATAGLGSAATAGLGSAATAGLGSAATAGLGSAATAAGLVPAGPAGLVPAVPAGIDAAAIPDKIIDATNVTSLITSTKAKDVMDFYQDEVISKLHCDKNMHGYINEHIIQPVFAVASKHIAEVGSHHLTDLAKTTTESHLKKCVLLIKGQLDTFGAILNIASIQPADNTIPNIIIPQYIHWLFELFVYSEYASIVDISVGIARDNIQAYITKLKSFNVQIDNYIKDDKYPEGVMSMNGLKLPAEWNDDGVSESDKNKMITKELIIAEFKKLFKSVAVKAKGGRRKSRTKKHKTKYLPVTKHGSRRKHP